MAHFNDQVIAEFRANREHVSHGFGSSLLLIHTVGRNSGEARVNPALSLRDGEDWLVVGTAAGAASDPAWVLNLRATPETTIEVPALQTGSQHVEDVAVLAQELEGDERERAFTRFQAKSAAFCEYQRNAGERTLPIIRFRRQLSAPPQTTPHRSTAELHSHQPPDPAAATNPSPTTLRPSP